MNPTGRHWTIDVNVCGRPLTLNGVHKMHPIAATKARHIWRDAATYLARAARIPAIAGMDVEVQAHYPNRAHWADIDGTAITVKGIIDGIVLAGVVPDDSPRWFHRLTILSPVLSPGDPAGIVVRVIEVSDADA